jgi:pimeloyl-ACP methyl ester carboxylesterase
MDTRCLEQPVPRSVAATMNSNDNAPAVATVANAQPQQQLSFDIANIVLFNTAGGMTGFRYQDVPCWARPVLWLVQNVVLGPVLGPVFFQNFKTRDNVYSILTQGGVYRNVTNVNDELLELLLAPADDDGAEAVFLAVFGGPAGPTAESLLPRVTVPVLALWGEHDPWTPLDAGLHPGRSLPPFHGSGQMELRVIPGAGHFPHDEYPELVNAELLAFLQRQEQRSS